MHTSIVIIESLPWPIREDTMGHIGTDSLCPMSSQYFLRNDEEHMNYDSKNH